MRIGIDATCLENSRGYGRHARALLGALSRLDTVNQYVLFKDTTAKTSYLPANVEVRHVSAGVPTVIAASANGRRSARDMWRMSRAMSSPNLDVLLFPTVYSYVPVISKAKKILIIHDVIAEKFPRLTMPTGSARFFWKTKVALGRWQADAIATVSEYSRRGLVHHFGIKPERIHVVGEASDQIFRRLENPGLTPLLRSLELTESQRLVVYVGGFSPHKNLQVLVAAFGQLSRNPSFADAKLVLVGEHEKEIFHSYAGTIKQQIEESGLSDSVKFTGYLPDEELVVLLNRASVCVLPSLIEGFGLPAVEAAACGCPVVATRESPLPELLGAGGLYHDPERQEELEKALVQVLESATLRQKMGEAGQKAAGKLTWDAAARQMISLFNKVAA